MVNPRQLALIALRNIYRQGAYSHIALNRVLSGSEISKADQGLLTELVYGVVRRQRTLDALINQLGKKKAHQQPSDLRIILHLGFYQLRYLDHVPESAAVNTSVELAKVNGFGKLSGVVNGMLRQYTRLAHGEGDPLILPEDAIERLGVLHSFPDWIVERWEKQFGLNEASRLCEWFNAPSTLDLRINPLMTSREEVESAFAAAGIALQPIPHLPQALRLNTGAGAIQNLPGYSQGWWSVQDSSAQLVSHVVNPQPGEVVIDACAAPGGKTTHIAELMGDNGTIWACDRSSKRLEKVIENAERLQLKAIKIRPGDSRSYSDFNSIADRVVVDAPCSGLGTLHKRPDLRWRQTLLNTRELSQLQRELLEQAATWVKPGGVLVYATCTLHALENEEVIQSFLENHPQWEIQPPSSDSASAAFSTPEGWIKVLPYEHDMDGFFIAKLQQRF